MANEELKHETYMQGMLDGLTYVSQFCANHLCEQCPINILSGDMECSQWMAQNPKRALSIVTDEGIGHTYFEEFSIRNPECEYSVEEIAKYNCAGMIFDNTKQCPMEVDDETGPTTEQCIECWKRKYDAGTAALLSTIDEEEEDEEGQED